MNWFETLFAGWLQDPEVVTALSDWHLRGLILAALFTGLWLLRKRSINGRGQLGCLVIGVVADQLELPEMLATGLSAIHLLPERIAMFSGAILLILICMAFGFGLVAACLRRGWRSRDRLVTGGVLAVVTTLLWGYHTLLINGWLMASLEAEAEQAQLVIPLGGADDAAFEQSCASLGYDCLTGEAGQTVPYADPHVSQLATSWLLSTRQGRSAEGQPLGFTLADGLATPQTPFALAYAEREGRFRLVVEREHSRLAFDAAQLSFFILANVATAFWVVLGGLVIWLHRRRKPRKAVGG